MKKEVLEHNSKMIEVCLKELDDYLKTKQKKRIKMKRQLKIKKLLKELENIDQDMIFYFYLIEHLNIKVS